MMRRKISTMLVAVLLAVLLMLGGCQATIDGALGTPPPAPSQTTAPEKTPQPSAEPIPTQTPGKQGLEGIPFDKFSDIEYVRPDIGKVMPLINEVTAMVKKSGDAKAILDGYDAVLMLIRDIDTMCSVANIRYSMDISDKFYKDELAFLEEAIADISVAFDDLTALITDSKYKSDAAARWGQDYMDAMIKNRSLNNAVVSKLSVKEQQLVREYESIATSFKIKYDGKMCAIEDLYALASTQEEYNEFIAKYYGALSKKLTPIFKKLRSLRADIAKELGFKTVSDYEYAYYDRDYTPSDAKALHANVKKHIVPLFKMVYEKYLSAADELSSQVITDENYEPETFEIDDSLKTFEKYAKQVSPIVEEAFANIQKHETYDLDARDNKLEGGFSTSIGAYNVPFLLMNWDKTQQSLSTFIHEMGHVSSFWQGEKTLYDAEFSLDVAEIDSQGLEMLFLKFYDEIYRFPTFSKLNQLQAALISIISGSMEDEFQQIMYEDTSLSMGELNDIYTRLSSEYGFDSFGYSGASWVSIPHTFQTPLYYISYCTSMIGALQLFEVSITDYDKALELYDKLLNRNIYTGYNQFMEENGLGALNDEQTLIDICDTMEKYIATLVPDKYVPKKLEANAAA